MIRLPSGFSKRSVLSGPDVALKETVQSLLGLYRFVHDPFHDFRDGRDILHTADNLSYRHNPLIDIPCVPSCLAPTAGSYKKRSFRMTEKDAEPASAPRNAWSFPLEYLAWESTA